MRNYVDNREQYTPGWKFHDWELKGVPLRVEIGPRDLEKDEVTFVRRDNFERFTEKYEDAINKTVLVLEDIQSNLLIKSKNLLKENTFTTNSYEEFKERLSAKGGFIKAGWCLEKDCEDKVKEETGADIRVIPFDENTMKTCIYCMREAKKTVYFAKSY